MTTITRSHHLPTRWHVVPVATGLLLTAGVVTGVVAWAHQLDVGLAGTGMGGVIAWGLYSVMAAFWAILSAGALGVGCVAVLRRGYLPTQVARLALGVAVGGAAAAVLTQIVDVARPERLLNLVLHPSWTAPLVWNVYVLLATLVVSALLLARTGRRPLSTGSTRVLAVLGLLAAVALPSTTAWHFALQVGRATLNDPLMAPVLVSSAVAAGAAAVTLSATVGTPRSQRVDVTTRNRLAAAFAGGLLVTGVLVGSGYITAVRSGPPEQAAVDLLLPGGSWSWMLWSQVVLAAVALTLVAVPRLRQAPGVLGVAAACSMTAVFVSLLALVLGGQAEPTVALPPGVPSGRVATDGAWFERIASYAPTWTEYGVIVGLVAVFVAIVLSTASLAVRHEGRP